MDNLINSIITTEGMENPDEKVAITSNSSDGNGYQVIINIIISTFISVFLAELGDKTQIATLLLSAESGKPFQVFIGASLALISSTLVVVILGRWFSSTISKVRIKLISGVLLISLGIWYGIQSAEFFFQKV